MRGGMLPLSGDVISTRYALPLLLALLAATACQAESEPGPGSEPVAAREVPPRTAWAEIGSELFELELALDSPTRFRGLGGRTAVAANGGMLFVFPRARRLAFVMRDCPIDIDVAYLDDTGRILAIHTMRPEPPRGRGEDARAYEARLPGYPSPAPARFAIETAGGRLAEVGAEVGQRVVFDAETLAKLAR